MPLFKVSDNEESNEPLTVTEEVLKEKGVLLVDIREAEERSKGHLGGIHIPMSELLERKDELKGKEKVVLYCQGGVRSEKMTLALRKALPESSIYSLGGGFLKCKYLIDNH